MFHQWLSQRSTGSDDSRSLIWIDGSSNTTASSLRALVGKNQTVGVAPKSPKSHKCEQVMINPYHIHHFFFEIQSPFRFFFGKQVVELRKTTSLVLRGAIQLLLALWVEATVLYRLKCCLANDGHWRPGKAV